MDDENNNLTSMSGAPIWRHQAKEREVEFAVASEDLPALEDHIERCVGTIDGVFHELVSDLVHVDVHVVPPDVDRNFHTLITTGMSDRPMSPPGHASECRYAEVLIELPADWPLTDEAFKDEKNYWPIRMLKTVARLPHEYDTWVWMTHSLANTDPPEPYDPSVKFTGCMLMPAFNLSSDLLKLQVRPDKEVWFFAVVSLYQEEMDLKLRKGSDALFDAFEQYGVTELIDPQRPNVAKQRWFRW